MPKIPLWLGWSIFVGVIVIFISIVTFAIAFYLKKRRVAKSKKLFVEVYLKKGGRDSIIASIDNEYIKTKKEGIERRYFIIKEAIQEEFRNTLKGPLLFKYIQFDEDLSTPFIMSLLDGKIVKKYIGSERIEQFLKTKIWEQVGGLGGAGDMMKYLGIGVLVFGGILVAVLLLRK